jgi:hypothetical protein
LAESSRGIQLPPIVSPASYRSGSSSLSS